MLSREEYLSLSEEKRAELKALHVAIRNDRSFGERTRNLAWGFIRGFKYRRIERSHHRQFLGGTGGEPHLNPSGYLRLPEGQYFEHNMPNAVQIARLLAKHSPEFAGELSSAGYGLAKDSRIAAWLADLSGAIPAPVRIKKPYVGKAAE